MNKRRPMTAALDMTPEKLAFIRGEPTPGIVPMPAPSGNDIDLPPPATVVEEPAAAPAPKPAIHPKTTVRPPKKPSNDDISELSGIRIPITTRLTLPTANALERAHLQQKLKKATPATKQDILEVAVEEWLKDHGYLV